jgi:hypothetical protein
MYKKTLTALCIAGTLVATPLFASNFFHKLTAAHSTKTNKTSLKAKAALGNFVDFSGTWEGTCDDDNYADTMTIKNTDSSFAVDGLELSIGSLETLSTNDSDSSFISHLALEWNEDNSKLLINGSFVNYSPNHHTGFPNMFAAGRASFSLAGNQLVTEFTSYLSSGESETSVCTYHKK